MADAKLTDLTETTSPAVTDLLYVVTDSGASPTAYVSQKVTIENVAASLGGQVKIDEQTPSGTGVVTFSSLGSYTHLEIHFLARGTQSATETNINFTVNGDTGANYDRELILGTGGNPSATVICAEAIGGTSGVITAIAAANAASGHAGSGTITIADYRNTTFHKQAISINALKTADASGGFSLRHWSVAWRSTSAITSITLTLASGNYVAGSKFTLYGRY